jgi:ribonuclease HI
MKITIYTDGSSRGNPGPGGWAAVILTPTEVIELGGREDMTTNNRMELIGTIEGLKHVNSKHKEATSVEVCTDSQYVKKGMTEWIQGWIKKGWKNSMKKDVLNRDLWEVLLHEETRLKKSGVTIIWKYVQGHAGVPGNERADVIATGCADNASHLQLYRGEVSAYPYF